MASKKKNQVIVRTYSAGVHYGSLVSQKGKEVVLADARRIWRWRGANTLHEVARTGIASDKSAVSVPVAKIVLTEAIEILPCSEAAAKTIEATKWQP